MSRDELLEINRKYFVNGHANMNKKGIHHKFTDHVFDKSTRATDAGSLLEKYQYTDDFGFILHGNAGSGKTYLFHCLANQIWEQVKNNEDVLLSYKWNHHDIEKFLLFETSSAIARKSRDFSQRDINFNDYCETYYLFIDDLGVEYSSDWVVEYLYEIIDYRIRNRKPFFISTNNSMATLKSKLGERIVSRILEGCIPVELNGDDRRKNIMQLNMKKLRERSINKLNKELQD